MKQKWKLGCFALALMLTISGCAAAFDNGESETSVTEVARDNVTTGGYAADEMVLTEDMDDAAPMETQVDSIMPDPGSGGTNSAEQERKLVMTYDISMQTINFDQCLADLDSAVAEYGGFTQYSRISGQDMYETHGSRSADFTVRVPVESAQALVDKLGGTYNITNRSSYQDDITNNYYDVQSRVKSLEIQRDRLMEMMEQSTNMEDLLAIERQLQSVLYELDSYTSMMERMDSQVAMSTVNFYIYEVVKYDQVKDVPVGFGQRIGDAWGSSWIGFVASLQSFVIFLIWALPFLIILAIALVILLLVLRSHRKRRKNAPAVAAPPANQPQAPDADGLDDNETNP